MTQNRKTAHLLLVPDPGEKAPGTADAQRCSISPFHCRQSHAAMVTVFVVVTGDGGATARIQFAARSAV
jgi:hypothetical protein